MCQSVEGDDAGMEGAGPCITGTVPPGPHCSPCGQGLWQPARFSSLTPRTPPEARHLPPCALPQLGQIPDPHPEQALFFISASPAHPPQAPCPAPTPGFLAAGFCGRPCL